MHDSGRRRWFGSALLVGALYFAIGFASSVLAGMAPSRWMVLMWRWAAFFLCGAAFVAHLAREVLRHGSGARAAAWRAAVAVAIGGFALALAANLHDLTSAAGYRPRMLVALVAWPLITAVPAFVAALAGAAGLGRWRAGAR